jgi:hypothetical protein
MKGIVVIVAIVVVAGGASRAQGSGQRPENPTPQPAATPDAHAVAPAPASRPARPEGGWWDDVFAEKSVPLGTILASPEIWRDVPVSFAIQYRQPGKSGTSFFTRFEPDQWLSFVAWPDEAPLWEKKAFDADFPHLFIRRNSADVKTIGTAATYDRFVVSGIVRDVIKGKPWIEVVSVRKLAGKITEGCLVHLVKGLMLRDHRRYDAAAREFEAADGETIPVGVRLLGMREHAFALLNSKKPRAAEEKLLAALALDPDNSETAVALAHVREVAKTMPDRSTSRPVPVAQPPKQEDEEPVVPGPPDPLADRPRKKTPPRAPESRPAGGARPTAGAPR